MTYKEFLKMRGITPSFTEDGIIRRKRGRPPKTKKDQDVGNTSTAEGPDTGKELENKEPGTGGQDALGQDTAAAQGSTEPPSGEGAKGEGPEGGGKASANPNEKRGLFGGKK
jgi:hypothetical protein